MKIIKNDSRILLGGSCIMIEALNQNIYGTNLSVDVKDKYNNRNSEKNHTTLKLQRVMSRRSDII